MRKAILAAAAALSFAKSTYAFNPIPTFPPVEPAINGIVGKWVYTVTGIVTSGAVAGVEAAFNCTNMEAIKTAQVGVEIYNFDGALLNDISAGNGFLVIPPGHTRTLVTTGIASLGIDEFIDPLTIANQGVARIISNSAKIVCNAYLMDDTNIPPTSMMSLPMIKGAVQKGN